MHIEELNSLFHACSGNVPRFESKPDRSVGNTLFILFFVFFMIKVLNLSRLVGFHALVIDVDLFNTISSFSLN